MGSSPSWPTDSATAGARRRSASPPGPMVDRATERQSLRTLARGLYRYRELIRHLVLKDLKLKYRGSVFGFLWSLVNPLLMIVVYTLAFTYILRIRTPGFVFYLMLGILAWTFFANSLGMSTGSIADNGRLLKSVVFPRAILPIATVLFNLVQYLLTAMVFLPILLWLYGVSPAAPMLLFPVFLSLQVLLTVGLALLLATGTTFFRDIRHLLEIALAVMFWTTPILYELRQVPEAFRLAILMSPLSPFVVAYQRMFYYREWPEPLVWLLATGYALVVVIAGARTLMTFEDQFAEQL